MAATTVQYQHTGKNSEVEAPPWFFTGTIATTETDTWTFLNVVQYLKVKNHGSGSAYVGVNSESGVGVNGTAEHACYFELAAGESLELPAELSFLAIKAPSGAAKVSIAATLSRKPASFGVMKAGDYFDGVESLDTNRYTT